jgi:hypothetical protein
VIHRQLESEFPLACLRLDLARRVEQVLFDERLADLEPAGLQEV